MLRPLLFVALLCPVTLQAAQYASHPPLRTAPAPSDRPLAKGPAHFVDAARGSDENDGSKEQPWQTVNHALRQLTAGDTLYLRGGSYYENVYCAARGREDAPITIRSYPGEQAVIDGSLREFFESPGEAWQPVEGGAAGEFRSTRRYLNLRNVLGSFGDSMVGLNTYYHSSDLRAEGEIWNVPRKKNEVDAEPLYCGPGLWYDSGTGYLHVRLAHTHLPEVPNYEGETDPRRLPLVVAPFRSVPLHIDGAQHLRLEDLVIRGGGYDAVIIDLASHVTLDNVTVWCGTYGLRVARTRHLRLVDCGLYGNVPPWLFRSDTSKRAYPGRPYRDITRLNTHSPLVIEAGREFSVYAHPMNDHWEIAHTEFTESADGVYLGGINLEFHHNLVENMQDDGIYLSQMYPRHRYMGGGAEMRIYQNVIGRCLTAFAFGGTEDTRDTIYLYRNLVDLRQPIYTGRPRAEHPDTVGVSYGKLMGDHGSPPWPAMNLYHNTFVMRGGPARAGMYALTHLNADHPRRVFNNIFFHFGPLPGYANLDPSQGVQADGNLFWKTGLEPAQAEGYFKRYRASEAYERSKEVYPPGFSTNSLVADPRFRRAQPEGDNDYRLQPNSPAVNAGVPLPQPWPDPLRAADAGQPDIGLLPLGSETWPVGRRSR